MQYIIPLKKRVKKIVTIYEINRHVSIKFTVDSKEYKMRKNMQGKDITNVTYTANGLKTSGKSPVVEIVGTGNKSTGAKIAEMLIALALLAFLIFLVINLPNIL